MNKLNSYITRYLLVYLVMAIGISTFVMMAGNFARVFDMIARGVSVTPLLLYVACRTPMLLGYTIPMGLLVSTVLLFNRMSAENEVNALRASGVSLLQVIAPPLLLSILLSLCCFYIQFQLGPMLNHRARVLIREAGVRNPLALLEAGAFNHVFDGFIIKLDEKEGNDLRGVHVLEIDPRTQKLQRNIAAPTGRIEVDEAAKQLRLILHNASIISVNQEAPDDPRKLRRMFAEQITLPMDYGEAINRRNLVRRVSDMTLRQLFAHARLASEMGIPTAQLFMELHMRAALALAPFSFLLIGIPLGLQISRRETSSGLVGAIVIAFFYFGSIMLVEMLADQPHLHPRLLVWVPNILCQAGGLYGLWRKR